MWKIIGISVGLQLAALLVSQWQDQQGPVLDPARERVQEIGFVSVFFAGIWGGMVAGAVVDRRTRNQPPRSRLWHLFVMIFQFALIFTIVRQASMDPWGR